MNLYWYRDLPSREALLAWADCLGDDGGECEEEATLPELDEPGLSELVRRFVRAADILESQRKPLEERIDPEWRRREADGYEVLSSARSLLAVAPHPEVGFDGLITALVLNLETALLALREVHEFIQYQLDVGDDEDPYPWASYHATPATCDLVARIEAVAKGADGDEDAARDDP